MNVEVKRLHEWCEETWKSIKDYFSDYTIDWPPHPDCTNSDECTRRYYLSVLFSYTMFSIRDEVLEAKTPADIEHIPLVAEAMLWLAYQWLDDDEDRILRALIEIISKYVNDPDCRW